MAKLRILTMIALLCGAFGLATADELQMEDMAKSAGPRPTRGMTAASVEAKFGEPESRKAAVGNPPISSWEYKDFVVFFEYDRVIHAVVKHHTPS
jgi:hypothetical protein